MDDIRKCRPHAATIHNKPTEAILFQSAVPALANSSISASTGLDPLPERSTSPFRDRLTAWLGIALSVTVLAVVLYQFKDVEFASLTTVPRTPFFWTVLVASYLLSPASEWLIYRKIWRLPFAGIIPLMRKQVANEIVLGYSGEAHFYFWARRHAGITGSPFGAIKDVSVMSAVAGNLTTLAMMLVMAPALAAIITGTLARTFVVSVAIVVFTSLMMFALRHKLFSLPDRDLRMIFAVQLLRVVISLVLIAILWSLMLPGVKIGEWVALAAMRMMVSRLPLLPNKEVMFAGLTMVLLGRNTDVAVMTALIASLTLGLHLAVGAITGAGAFIGRQA
ncbi:MAG: hypothetical protein V4564_15535 [Pseudomonadota bacterium]